MSEGVSNKQERISWIGSLRGIAALLVFISHLYLINGTSAGFVIGRIGVVIFFLMTGYLSVKSRESRTGKQYLFNRFMRMFPVYWLILIVHFAVVFIFSENRFSFTSLLANMTQFEEFLGFDTILGGSWMLPMQDVYFAALSLFGISFWNKRYEIKKFAVDMPYFVMASLMILAVITGVVRYITKLPLPAAFFLLLAVAFLGMYKNLRGGVQTLLIIFEIGLVPAALFAYPDEWIYYIIAYNIGIIGFLVVERYQKLNIKIFDDLGKIGFTFFLGADTLMVVLGHFVDFTSSPLMIAVGYVAKFILATAYAYVITRFVEKPLLKWAKNLERIIN